MALTIKEAIELLKWVRISNRNIEENNATISGIVSQLEADSIPVFNKTIHLVISYDTGANALDAVDAIKARVQGGETSGEAVSPDYAYNFYLE
jgi:hypothetical protein